jgi:hypothetical protein
MSNASQENATAGSIAGLPEPVATIEVGGRVLDVSPLRPEEQGAFSSAAMAVLHEILFDLLETHTNAFAALIAARVRTDVSWLMKCELSDVARIVEATIAADRGFFEATARTSRNG